MAWVTEYDLKWTSVGEYGAIYLQRDGGSYQRGLKLKRNSLEIKDSLPSWDDPIVRKNCSFTVVNDLDDFYELMPLMTISNGQIKVKVTFYYSGHVTIFDGFLNCEAVNQNMINKSDIRLTASGLVEKLKWQKFADLNTIQDMSLIDIIDGCLRLSGTSYPIYVNASLYEAQATLGAGDTFLNRTAVSTELWWVDNIEKVDPLEIIQSILRSCNCYLYWFESRWYLEHYENLALTPKPYVRYISGSSYDYETPGDVIVPIAPNTYYVHAPTTMPQMNTSQMLTVMPGVRQLDINLDQKPLFNLMNGDLTDINITSVSPAWVQIRHWHAKDFSATWAGYPSSTIANAIWRVGTYNIVEEDGVLNGLTTNFKVSVNSDSELTIKWKVCIKTPPSAYPNTFWAFPEDMKVVFNWYLRKEFGDYARYDEDFELEDPEDPDLTWITHAVMQPNTHTIWGTNFDPIRHTYEGQFVIPIGELYGSSSGWDEDISFIFRMGTELVTDEGDSEVRSIYMEDDPCTWIIYGDFHASVNSGQDDNLLEGEVTTDFLDKKVLDMEVYDAGWNYRNGLKRGSMNLISNWGWWAKTFSWTFDGVGFASLAEKLMESKFRLYRVARQKIRIEYNTALVARPLFWPLTLFYDNKQSDKKFLMCVDIFRPESDSHTMELWEYDDDEEITLV